MRLSKKALVLLSGIAILILVALVRIIDPTPMQQIRLAYFDHLQRLMPRSSAELPVRVVDIDEASLASVGQWPWPRHILAQLVENLSEAGAAAIVFDFIFAEPDRMSLSRIIYDPMLSQWFDQSSVSPNADLVL